MPKLLWVSPLSVHDSASNSAAQIRNMLLSLKARNVDIVGLSSLSFVHESGTSLFTDLEEKLKGEDNSFNLTDNDITFIYVRTRSRALGEMVSQEQRNFYAKFCALISSFRPDIVMGSGTDMLSMVCFDEARRRGIPTVYTLLDGTPRRFNFPNIDVVVTDTNAISNLYAKQYGINALVTGPFIPVERLSNDDLAKKKENEANVNRVTMVNPSLEKGLGIFIRIAGLSFNQDNLKNFKFTVVETHEGQFSNAVEQLHYKDGVKLDKNLISKIDVIKPNTPLKDVFMETKVLVAPSLCFESGVNIAREAVANNIPVLGSNQIGLVEAIGAAGVVVDPPQYCIADHKIAPNDEDIDNFIRGLQMLVNDNGFAERCASVAQNYDVNISATRLATVLKPLFDKQAGNNPQILRNGSLI